MRTFASIAVAYLLATAILWSAFGLFARISRPHGADPQLAALIALIGIGLTGYVAFFVYRLSPTFGLVGSVVASSALLAALLWRRRIDDDVGGNAPFVLAALFGLLYLACAFLFVPQGVPGLVNLLFFELVRSGDNNAALAFAHAVYKGMATSPPNGEWYFSDRPPLQTGFDLFFTPLRALFGNDDAHQAAGTLLQVSVLAAVGLLGAALRLRGPLILLAVLTIGGSGFVFYNSIYVWPKLLAATFFLVALVPIVRAWLAQRRLTTAETLVLAAASALAMLSHGTAAFSLLALSILLAITFGRFFSFRTFALAAVTAAALSAPWAGYVRFVDPNISRLLKMHLTDGDNLSAEPFLTMLAHAYRNIGFQRWGEYRMENLKAVFGSALVDRITINVAERTIDPTRPRHPARDVVTAALDATKLSDDFRSLASVLRTDQREFAFRALGVLNLAWPILLLAVWPRWRKRLLDRRIIGLIALNTLTALIWVILEFNPSATVNTHASYAMIALAMLTAIVLLDRVSPALARAVCCVNVALSLALWVLMLPGPALTAARGINWIALVTAALAAAAIVFTARRAAPSDPAAADHDRR